MASFLTTSGYFLVALILLSIITLMSALTLYKTRRIHLATYALKEDLNQTKAETEQLFRQIQALLAIEKLLRLPKALPPMRGWAGSPDFLLRTAEEIFSRTPKIVMECSSGVSTLISARALQITGKGHVFSLEHDPVYAEKTRQLLHDHGLKEWATVLDSPLRETDVSSTPWYSLEAIPSSLQLIDILVVDGPPGTTGPLARYPALPLLHSRLNDSALIIVDDAARDDEQAMLSRWQQEFPDFKQIKVYCEKGCALLERVV